MALFGQQTQKKEMQGNGGQEAATKPEAATPTTAAGSTETKRYLTTLRADQITWVSNLAARSNIRAQEVLRLVIDQVMLHDNQDFAGTLVKARARQRIAEIEAQKAKLRAEEESLRVEVGV